ncbi:hypothetical protein VOLCADRAFT_100375 [Volvox carteri f. nagariensis]|uniref:Uncharacterized protein n=1 Tax=Volvox carteri f. nagariensis TaxID=3068 RepID=D8UK32_VOLCA|nr:uncharacterized protein VOLCADRAFT_100375 [Volvox carteri f. nagariensis]EFJ39926.1 hypothetical protein VOLCADRAFT_100375 [Volvox carteri f. nagariensis]|eukprot:XP_002959007.1 hypothetical protein VOLCADRAFT_100375 [Volvox carteri f. nagariensis]
MSQNQSPSPVPSENFPTSLHNALMATIQQPMQSPLPRLFSVADVHAATQAAQNGQQPSGNLQDNCPPHFSLMFKKIMLEQERNGAKRREIYGFGAASGDSTLLAIVSEPITFPEIDFHV